MKVQNHEKNTVNIHARLGLYLSGPHKLIAKYPYLTSLVSKRKTIPICRPDNKQNRCKLVKNVNMRSFALEEVRHLACGVMGIACTNICVGPQGTHFTLRGVILP